MDTQCSRTIAHFVSSAGYDYLILMNFSENNKPMYYLTEFDIWLKSPLFVHKLRIYRHSLKSLRIPSTYFPEMPKAKYANFSNPCQRDKAKHGLVVLYEIYGGNKELVLQNVNWPNLKVIFSTMCNVDL